MNCECVSQVEKKAVGVLFKQRPILTAKLKEITFSIEGNNFELKTCSHLEAELEGLKSKQLIAVVHSYCPFCGVKIDKSESSSEPQAPSQDAPQN